MIFSQRISAHGLSFLLVTRGIPWVQQKASAESLLENLSKAAYETTSTPVDTAVIVQGCDNDFLTDWISRQSRRFRPSYPLLTRCEVDVLYTRPTTIPQLPGTRENDAMRQPLRHIRPLAFVPLLFAGLLLGTGTAHGAGETVQVGPFTLPPGEAARIEFQADIDDPVPANVSSVSNQGTVTFDTSGLVPTDDPNAPNAADPTVTPLVFEADVSITKMGPAQAVVGTNITYTLTVINGGPDNAPNVVVTDTLPAGVTFVSASFGSTDCSESLGVVTCNLGTLTDSQSVDISIVVTAPMTTGMLTNMASLTTDATDDMPGNNSASADTEIIDLQADLSVTKSDSPDPVGAGQELVYTVTVNNAGPDPAENVVASDTLPGDVTFVSTSGCDNDPDGVPDCNLGTIAAGGAKQYTITVTVNASTQNKTITNSVSVASDTADPTPGNNADSEDTQVQADSDGDGFPDSTDQCVNSDLGGTVSIGGCDSGAQNKLLASPQGCTINDEIQKIIDNGPRNHGKFVSRVAKLVKRLQKTGVISPEESDAIKECAAEADIP